MAPAELGIKRMCALVHKSMSTDGAEVFPVDYRRPTSIDDVQFKLSSLENGVTCNTHCRNDAIDESMCGNESRGRSKQWLTLPQPYSLFHSESSSLASHSSIHFRSILVLAFGASTVGRAACTGCCGDEHDEIQSGHGVGVYGEQYSRSIHGSSF